MRPTLRSLTVSFTFLLGLASYSLANADVHNENIQHNVSPTLLAAK